MRPTQEGGSSQDIPPRKTSAEEGHGTHPRPDTPARKGGFRRSGVISLSEGSSILLEGLPGIGKTTVAASLAEALLDEG